MTERDDYIAPAYHETIDRYESDARHDLCAEPERIRRYIAARATRSLSYGDVLYAQAQGWCPSSPDGMGPHRPDDTTEPLTCAECGAEIEDGLVPEKEATE